MKSEDLLKEFKAITERMVEVAEKKNHDYSGTQKNAFGNFKRVETLGICSTEQGFLARMTDKLCRVSTLIRKDAKVADESLQDTLLDLANYSILMSIYISQKKKDK